MKLVYVTSHYSLCQEIFFAPQPTCASSQAQAPVLSTLSELLRLSLVAEPLVLLGLMPLRPPGEAGGVPPGGVPAPGGDAGGGVVLKMRSL